jgi:hypothetical protein
MPCQHPRLLPPIWRTGHGYQRLRLRDSYPTRQTSPDTQAGAVQRKNKVHEAQSQRPVAQRYDSKIHICLSCSYHASPLHRSYQAIPTRTVDGLLWGYQEEENAKTVCTFYRLTIDYRLLNKVTVYMTRTPYS